jgi:hypothetical protein
LKLNEIKAFSERVVCNELDDDDDDDDDDHDDDDDDSCFICLALCDLREQESILMRNFKNK